MPLASGGDAAGRSTLRSPERDLDAAMTEAEAWLERAEALLTERRLTDALPAFAKAEELGASPDRCEAGRWMTAMLGGDFATAWRASDTLRARNAPDPHRLWNGEDLAGARVIVRCLHGLGDTVQMLQYASWLNVEAASVVYEVPPRLLQLASCFRGVREVITWGELAAREPPAWDVQLEVMELPYLFRTAQKELPIATRYLGLPAEIVRTTSAAMGRSDTVRVGLVWAAGEWNPERSIPLAALHPLLQQEGFEFWSLQGGPAGAQAAGLKHMRDAQAICGEGLLALAATIAHLDLVITVDTLAAHLAGALGTPAWVLLQQAADWRWMTGRNDSPWYPRMRLFRQRHEGQWKPVVDALLLALEGGA